MKSRTKITFTVILLVLAITIGLWLTRPRHPLTPVVTASEHKAPAQPPAVLPLPKEEDLPRIVQPYAHTPYLRLADPRWKEYEIKRKADPAWEWKMPIEFYGKVVDEKNQPVAGADIEFEWNGTTEKYGGDGVAHRKIISDITGSFLINGIEGKGLGVDVSKEGYHQPKTWNNGSFEYAGFWEPTFIEPDRNKPVIFHLLKRPVAEPTYQIYERLLIQPPALETYINLLTTKVQSLSPADLFVKFTRSRDAGYGKSFDWTVSIEGRNGGKFFFPLNC